MDMDIFITGYSIKAPQSDSTKEFYENLLNGNDMTTDTKRYPKDYLGLPPRTGTLKTINKFDNKFFNMNMKQVEKTDIILRLILEITHEALLDAKIPIGELKNSKTGVYVGHCFSDYLGRTSNDKEKNGYELVNGAHCMIANRISFFYNLEGPSYVVDTACSSSMTALHNAVRDLKSGTITRAIVAGASLTLDPNKNATFNAFNMLSPDGKCYTFDKKANGYCRSEGIGVIILESSQEVSYGYASILGTSINSDGFKEKGITYPSSKCQTLNMLNCIKENNIDINDVNYIEAHGTGTNAGDHNELIGLTNIFGKDKKNIPIGSVKSNMGHAEGASGIMSIIKCLLMFENNMLFKNLNFTETAHEPLLNGTFRVVTQNEPYNFNSIAISNYGFGGSNGFVILKKGNIKIISGQKSNSLNSISTINKISTGEELNRLNSKNNIIIDNENSNIEYDLQKLNELDKIDTKNNNIKKNNFIFSNSNNSIKSINEKYEDYEDYEEYMIEQIGLGNYKKYSYRDGNSIFKKIHKICFLFGGQGSQWNNMGKNLYKTNNIFRDTINRLSNYIKEKDKNINLQNLYENGNEWMNKKYSGLGIISYQIGCINILLDKNIKPDYYLGHSLGETVVGYISGIQNEKETILIGLIRSKLSDYILTNKSLLKTKNNYYNYELVTSYDTNNIYYVDTNTHNLKDNEELFDMKGLMSAVGLSSNEIINGIEELNLKNTCVACYNSPNGQTVSGTYNEMILLKNYLEEKYEDLFWRDIPTDNVAYHAPYLKQFYNLLHNKIIEFIGIKFDNKQELPINWLSTNGCEYYDSHYHVQNITNPVYFQKAIEKLPLNTTVLEIGPSSSLLTQIKRIRKDLNTIEIVKRLNIDSENNYNSIEAYLWKQGYDISKLFKKYIKNDTRYHILKRYPELWDHSQDHRIFTYKDYEYILNTDTNKINTITYNLKDKDNYLLDHKINGRSLFPATGHLYSAWQYLGLDKDIEFKDFEIKNAIVISKDDILNFVINICGDIINILYNEQIVATTKFTVHDDNLDLKIYNDYYNDNDIDTIFINRLQKYELYNHFKRYGYEYETNFQLLENSTYDNRKYNIITINKSKNIIAYLDNLLQTFLIDTQNLSLPTLIRNVKIKNTILDLEQQDTKVIVNKSINSIMTNNCIIEGLNITLATQRQNDKLEHYIDELIKIGEIIEYNDGENKILIDECRNIINFAINNIKDTDIYMNLNQNIKDYYKTITNDCENINLNKNEELYNSNNYYKLIYDIYTNKDELYKYINNGLLYLQNNENYKKIFNENICTNKDILKKYLYIINQEQKTQKIIELGYGTNSTSNLLIDNNIENIEKYDMIDINKKIEVSQKITPYISSNKVNIINNESNLIKSLGELIFIMTILKLIDYLFYNQKFYIFQNFYLI